jgi:hypothetical protein
MKNLDWKTVKIERKTLLKKVGEGKAQVNRTEASRSILK